MTPGGDGELLRALAEAFAKAWGEHPDNTVVDAEMAIAALRTVLREHPAAISQLGWQVRATVGAWGNKQEVLFAPPPREVQE